MPRTPANSALLGQASRRSRCGSGSRRADAVLERFASGPRPGASARVAFQNLGAGQCRPELKTSPPSSRRYKPSEKVEPKQYDSAAFIENSSDETEQNAELETASSSLRGGTSSRHLRAQRRPTLRASRRLTFKELKTSSAGPKAAGHASIYRRFRRVIFSRRSHRFGEYSSWWLPWLWRRVINQWVAADPSRRFVVRRVAGHLG